MSSSNLYDVAVIGAGVEGSATAYQLSKRNVRVLLLEQFPLPHSRGSSHGQSRITRKAYIEHFYTDMMHYSTDQWEQLQRESGTEIYKKTNFLALGQMGKGYLNAIEASLKDNNAEHTLLTPRAFQHKYPNFRYDDDWGGIVDPNGGVLMADKCLRAFQTQFVKNGGVLHDGEPVLNIKPGEICDVITNKAKYRAKSVVLCCGPWAGSMCRKLNLNLPLEPVRIGVYYWPERVPGSMGECPGFFDMESAKEEVYGLPCLEYPGHMKICVHHGPSIDPERRDSVQSDEFLQFIANYVKEHFPALIPKPSIVETCIYTNTPDKNFVLDHHPLWKNIIIGAGFSGHGFKLSPVVGKILADLSMGLNPGYDMSHFKISRFGAHPTSKL